MTRTSIPPSAAPPEQPALSRRRFLSAAAGSVGALSAGLLAPTTARADDDDEEPERSFTFVVVSRDADSGHLIVLSGAGAFDDEDLEGEGDFTHFDPTGGGPPFPIITHGTWRAKRFLSYDEIEGSPYGQIFAGILCMEVELRPEGGPPTRSAMEVVCNVGVGGLFTGKPEGVTLLVVGDFEFVPTGTGVTSINS